MGLPTEGPLASHCPPLLNIVFCLQPVVDIAAWHTAALFVQLVGAPCDSVLGIEQPRLISNLIRFPLFHTCISFWNRRCLAVPPNPLMPCLL